MIFSHSAFATSLQLTCKFWLTSLRFHFQNLCKSSPKLASHSFKMDSQYDIASKTFSILPKKVQGSSKTPPEWRQGAANSIEKSLRNFKTYPRRLEDHPRRLQDALKTPSEGSKTPKDASKSLDKRPQAPWGRVHVACKPGPISIPYRFQDVLQRSLPRQLICRCCPQR